MGVLSDLVVAPASDAERIANTPNPAEEFGGIDIKGIDSIKLESLHEIVLGEAEPLELLIGEGNGPWVFRLAEALTRALAEMSREERARVAKAWSETEEFSYDDYPLAMIVEILEEFTALAKRAVERREALLLWMSL